MSTLIGVPLDNVHTVFGDALTAVVDTVTEVINGQQVATQLRHVWTMDATGLYGTDAQSVLQEWRNAATALQYGEAGAASSLSPIEHLEANAMSVFMNTALAGLSVGNAAQQKAFLRDILDVQREYDALDAAMNLNAKAYGVPVTATLTDQTYLELEKTLQASPVLEELGMQGHGLNKAPAAKYRGYTNDFQNGVDRTTLYLGSGINHNENALTDFFDDSVISHVPYAVVAHNGDLIQLNQNGALETPLDDAVKALNDSMFLKAYRSSDFGSSPQDPTNEATTQFVHDLRTGPGYDLFGERVATSSAQGALSSLAPHLWGMDANGVYVTAADLAGEWKAAMTALQNGQGATLTPIQRLEGQAEMVFELSALATLSGPAGAAKLIRDRMDVQREFDAMAAALTVSGLNAVGSTVALTDQSYIAMERVIQNDPTLELMAMQGHGLNKPPAFEYRGYTADFQTSDASTRYDGPGSNHGENALKDFFDDSVISHAPYKVVMRNGHLEQLNQNAAMEAALHDAVTSLNLTMFGAPLKPSDFVKI